jgi:hypothetical protein
MQRKAVTRELGVETLPAAIADFVDREFEIARPVFEGRTVFISEEARQEADRFFCDVTSRCSRENA